LENGHENKLVQYGSQGLRERETQALSTEFQRELDITIEDELSLQDYIDVVLRRKWVVIALLIVTVVTAGIFSLFSDRVYRAKATIEISPENPKITNFEEVVTVETQQREFYETQFKLIKSKSLAKEVVRSLNLSSYSEFAQAKEDDGGWFSLSTFKNPLGMLVSSLSNSRLPVDDGEEKSELAKEQGLIRSFLRRLSITPDRKSRLVELGFESTDPKLAALAVNTVIDKYIDWVMERRLQATKSAREFLKRQLAQAKASLERAEEDLNKYAQTKGIVSLDEDLNLTYKQLSEINDAYSSAETNRLSKEALYREAEAGNYYFLPQVMNDPSVGVLNEEYTKLKSKYDNMSVTFGPNYPRIKELAAQMARVKNDRDRRVDAIAQSIKKDYQAALRKDQILKERAQVQKQRVAKLNDQTIQYRILKREVETNKSIYDNLLQRLKETEVTSAIRATNIQVVDYAPIPLFPYKPNMKLNMMLATIMGLMGGVSFAFVLDYFDTTIKDEEEIKKRFPLPFLGAVPIAQEGDVPEPEKAVYLNPRSFLSESFRVIRTSIMYSSADHSPKSFLVTSSQPLEGKTTTASNLALSLMQSGLRVIIVDGDLRRPRLHKIYLNNGKHSYGLSTYLVGKAELEGTIASSNVEGLDIIPAGPIP